MICWIFAREASIVFTICNVSCYALKVFVLKINMAKSEMLLVGNIENVESMVSGEELLHWPWLAQVSLWGSFLKQSLFGMKFLRRLSHRLDWIGSIYQSVVGLTWLTLKAELAYLLFTALLASCRYSKSFGEITRYIFGGWCEGRV